MGLLGLGKRIEALCSRSRLDGAISPQRVTQTVQAAHSVALLTAEFTADGKVMGSSPENGCHLLGVWSAGGQTLNWIDLTLSDCNYPD